MLHTVTCAPVIRTIRGIRSEVEVGSEQGLPAPSAIACDNLVTIPRPPSIGTLRAASTRWAAPSSTGPFGTPWTSGTDRGGT